MCDLQSAVEPRQNGRRSSRGKAEIKGEGKKGTWLLEDDDLETGEERLINALRGRKTKAQQSNSAPPIKHLSLSALARSIMTFGFHPLPQTRNSLTPLPPACASDLPVPRCGASDPNTLD